MAQLTDEIGAAWRALADNTVRDGWRSIRVTSVAPSVLMAARHFPANVEALLIGFDRVMMPPAERLPEGTGFSVVRLDGYSGDRDCLWIALSRQQTGNPELFMAMVGDIAHALESAPHSDGRHQLQLFLGRVRAWQEFMRKGAAPLGPEAEIGLIGELCFLEEMIALGIASSVAVTAWEGPFDAPQDFIVGTGAVEVKSTVAKIGFPAKISSLEQLDDSIHSPLFVAGQRFAVSDTGMTLPDWADRISNLLQNDHPDRSMFRQKLLAAGYADVHAHHYTRRVAYTGLRLLRADDGFPRLLPGNVPKGIRRATYEIDLDQVIMSPLPLFDVLKETGAI
jgi:hypothetical protein